ncbi:hypothetical protein PC123_g6386 [Phytophthora cactorum]|nr:hypothetical protein PC120_g5589 [Phytophthora cactorum]KAG4058647.1 hypothetical protein PC123_g6386 [Phytophthora cactorum]
MNLYQFFIIVAFYLHRVLPTAGAKTSVVVYKDDKCKAPAQYVSITSSLTCTPQANHYDPVCVKGAAGYTVSDCINYNRGGWDDVGVVRDTLEGVSYLGVEKYMAGRGGQGDYMTSAKMYRLDENCYSNAEGTASHRLTLDRSATITTYSDATCTNVKSMSMIRMEVIGVSQAWASMDDMTAFFGGVPPNFTVVGVYDDSTCSNAPTQITFSQGFKCVAPPDVTCRSDGGSHFAIPGCVSSFTDYSAALFGAKSPYLIVEEYSNPWCRLAENVTTYSADGSCHTNAGGTTSFRASINVADSTATITMYSDSECTFVTSDTNLDGQALSSSPCMLYQCESRYNCGRRYSVGGLGGPSSQGKKTAVVAYEDSSCLSTATSVTLKSSLTCTPQANHYDPVCVKGAAGYTVSDCINYNRGGWDDVGVVRDTLEGVSYLGVEKYMAGRGGQGDYMTSAKMYRLDENCYSNAEGTASHRLTLDRSATITTYSDATCTNVKSMSMIRMEVIGVSQAWASMDDMTAFFGGVPPNFTVVGVYDDSTCSNAPTQITFSQGFKCVAPPDVTCRSDGGSHFAIPGCVSSFTDYSAALFGAKSPYLIVEEYSNPWCRLAENVTTYSADGSCHTNAGGTTSFRASINVADSTATITMYSDSECTFVTSDTNLDGQALSSSPCMLYQCESRYNCGRRYSVGGLGGSSSQGKKSVVVVYEDSYCAISPIQLTFTTPMQCIPPTAARCETLFGGPNAVYETRECVDNLDKFVDSKFQSTAYLIVENYANGTSCQILNSGTIYAADGKCHLNATDGTYFTIIQDMDGSIAVASYPTSSCKESEAVNFIVDSWYVNTDRCFGDRIFRTSKMAIATTISIPATSTPIPQTTSPSVTEIEARLNTMFPAWLWDPIPPRIFESDGYHRGHHSHSPGHRHFP